MKNGDTARLEMRRARSILIYAEGDLSLRHWARAISSSYYAASHAAKAVLASVNISTKSHVGLKRIFSQHAVQDSDFPPDVARTLGELLPSRLTADYDPVEWETFTKEQAKEAASRAAAFVEEAGQWLIRRTEGQAEASSIKDS